MSVDHKQALVRIGELEHELAALRSLVILTDVALESVEFELDQVARSAPADTHRLRPRVADLRHQLTAVRRSLAVVR